MGFEYPNPNDYEPILDAEAWQRNSYVAGEIIQLVLFDFEVPTEPIEPQDK